MSIRQQKINGKDKLIQNVIDCGQALIDNAESIVGDEKYQTSIFITCDISANDNGYPEVTVERKFIPEKTVEENRNKG